MGEEWEEVCTVSIPYDLNATIEREELSFL